MEVKNKFTMIYSFKIIEGKEIDFISAWTELTKIIFKYAGSYGSRLHKADNQLFIGYAQWPNKETWENSGEKLPEIANEFRKQMHECCSEIKSEYEMIMVQDLLNEKLHTDIEK